RRPASGTGGIAYPCRMPTGSPTARLLDGVSLARALREEIGRDAARVAARGSPPSLRILLVGEDPASIAYIASKTRAAREAGCLADTVRLPATAPPERVIEEIE